MDEKKSVVAAVPPLEPMYVVGIGTSAGGLTALRTLFTQLPADPGMAFVVVVHLSPDHVSHIVEFLQPCSKMPVHQVTSTVALERSHVYVIPPNANLEAIDTHLRLSELEQRRGERAPIDHFMRTLAAAHDDHAIGILLTGSGSDGSLGIRRIKERGGLTIAQDPREAEFDSMPHSAIATGMVDLISPLREISDRLLRYCSTQPRVRIPDGDNVISAPDAAALEQILGEVSARIGQQLSMFMRTALLRRVRKRMQLRHVETLHDYIESLRLAPGEARELYDDLLFSATEFFREPAVFANIERHVLPALFDLKIADGSRLRAWSIGCSTGEEAYSLAILMLEEDTKRRTAHPLQVFASDLSSHALGRAREGLYPTEVAASVSQERLERFFAAEPGIYRVRREVRDIVVFATHDLFKDPPLAHLDIIVCRNRLCDLQPAVRAGVLHLFHYALEPHGVLIVGDKDKIDAPNLFVRDEGNPQTFRRRSGPTQPLALPSVLQPFSHVPSARIGAKHKSSAADGMVDAAVIHRVACEHYMPSVLVDRWNRVIHYSAEASRFLNLPGGELTHDVVTLAPQPMQEPLSEGIERARGDGRRWTSEPIDIQTPHGPARVALHVQPVAHPEAESLLLIVVEERRTRKSGAALSPDASSGNRIADLESELEQVKQRLQDLREGQQNDRQKLANTKEHLQTADAELDEVLAELESSREELQAVNEELTALDHENRMRLAELQRVSADMQHLLESTGVATLFLDRTLRIVRFTPQLTRLFNIRESDVGRPLTDLTHELRFDELEQTARQVLDTLVPAELEIADLSGHWLLMRMLPYRTAARRVDGLVLTLIDITDRRRAEDALRLADRRKDEFLAVLAHELRNPLAPISSGVEILKARPGDEKLVKQVSVTMGRQTKQLVRLVDDLMEVSRISGGKLNLRKSLVQLADVIRDAAAAVRPLIDQAGHELVIAIPDGPIELEADPARLTQVIANLLNNAARYTPRGGRLTISARRDGNDAVVNVTDTGIGIEEAALQRVFEMFYQASDGRQSRKDGLGIGLTIAKSLVEMHGGSIAVASAGLNQGTQFQVRLPIPRTAAPLASPPASPRAVHQSRRVLIVDDNVDAAQTLCVLLQTLGHHVHVATGGEQGLQLAEQLKPDIVMLDLMMPGMDGYEVARRIRQQSWGKDFILIALTGWGQDEHRKLTSAAGFDRHLTKPADISALEAALDQSRGTL